MNPSSKDAILRKQGLLNSHPDRVQAPSFLDHDFFDPLDLLQVKYEMLRCVIQGDLSVTQAARLHGFSRPAYYQIYHAFEQHGIAGLLPLKRGPQSAHKLNAQVMEFVDQLRDQDPHISVPKILEKIQRRFSLQIHRRSLERALTRPKKNLSSNLSLPLDSGRLAQAYEDLRLQVHQSSIHSGDYLLLLRMGFWSWSRSQAQRSKPPVARKSSLAPSELLHIVANMITSNLLPRSL